MKSEILYPGAFALLQCHLEYGESMYAESDAMVHMTDGLVIEGKVGSGGVLGSLVRKAMTNESFFVQTVSARNGAGTVSFAPSELGSIEEVYLDGTYTLSVQKGGFLAAESTIEVGTRIQNLAQGMFSREGFFVQEISGKGKVFLSSLGAIHALSLDERETAVIDNGHLVAWPTYMPYKLEKASKGIISSITSGEGLVCRFQGPGVVLIQTRKPESFVSWISSLLPNRSS